MATVALIVHDMRDDAETQARALARWLAARGDKLAILESNVDELHLEDVIVRDPHDLASDVALVVSLGGDGSMPLEEAGGSIRVMRVSRLGWSGRARPSGPLTYPDSQSRCTPSGRGTAHQFHGKVVPGALGLVQGHAESVFQSKIINTKSPVTSTQ